jgi:hypothetical protein
VCTTARYLSLAPATSIGSPFSSPTIKMTQCQMVKRWATGGTGRSSEKKWVLRQERCGAIWSARSISRTLCTNNPHSRAISLIHRSRCTATIMASRSFACLLHQRTDFSEPRIHSNSAQKSLAVNRPLCQTAASVFHDKDWHSSGVIFCRK